MDRIVRCITSNGAIMAAAIDSTYMVATAQQIHNTSAVATAAIGRLLTGASVMGSMLKQADASVSIKVNGGGPIGTLVAVAESSGNTRAYVEHPEITLPLKPNGKLDVGGAVGKDGLLAVMRDRGDGNPYSGHVELLSGEIAEDLTNYYAVSEQIPTVCALGVLVDKNDVKHVLAGGLLLQALPGALEEDIARLEKNAKELPPITSLLAQGMKIEDICRQALEGFEMEILDEFPVAYACPCSKERVVRAIGSLPADEIRTLADETGYAEATCHYCNKTYKLSREELETLAVSKEKGYSK